MLDLMVRYFHFISIMMLLAALTAEHLLIDVKIDRLRLKRVFYCQSIFMVSLLVIAITGVALWLFIGKPAIFYTRNGIFHGKLTVFLLIILLSIYPFFFLLKQYKSTIEIISLPRSIIMLIRTQLLLIVIIPFLAVCVAQGVGLK